jgi:hypothetical protein
MKTKKIAGGADKPINIEDYSKGIEDLPLIKNVDSGDQKEIFESLKSSVKGECIPGIKDGVCTSDETMNKLKNAFNLSGSKYDMMSKLKKMFKVVKERDLYNNDKIKKVIGLTAEKELMCNFKQKGPAEGNAWLSNFDIEAILQAWKGIYKKKGFFYFDYHPRDFADINMPLETTDLDDLIKIGYRKMGVVLNTDIHTGPGKHWVCIFCDFSTSGTSEDPWTLEYFNSSGNPPLQEFHGWLVSRCSYISKNTNKICKVIRVRNKQLQFGDSECGVYCLFYIWCRLEGFSYKTFMNINIPDEIIQYFRKGLFTK